MPLFGQNFVRTRPLIGRPRSTKVERFRPTFAWFRPLYGFGAISVEVAPNSTKFGIGSAKLGRFRRKFAPFQPIWVLIRPDLIDFGCFFRDLGQNSIRRPRRTKQLDKCRGAHESAQSGEGSGWSTLFEHTPSVANPQRGQSACSTINSVAPNYAGCTDAAPGIAHGVWPALVQLATFDATELILEFRTHVGCGVEASRPSPPLAFRRSSS